jgi:lipopolysaccharide export system ATP-binding protein
MIAGYIRPDVGNVSLNGQDITRLPVRHRMDLRLGHFPRGLGLPGEGAHALARFLLPLRHATRQLLGQLTPEAQIRARLRGMPLHPSLGRRLTQTERWHHADKVLEQFQLTALRSTPIAHLAGGEQRRLEIALCLAGEPLAVVLDEPFTGIDAPTVAHIHRILEELSRKGIGIILTDQNAREVLTIVDRAYLLQEGQVVTHSTREQLRCDPVAISDYLGPVAISDYLGKTYQESTATLTTAEKLAGGTKAAPLLELQGVVKYRRRRKLIDRVDLDVHAGEIVGLLGKNGAGKSTAVQMASGHLKPDVGKVIFNGTDITRSPAYQRARAGIGTVQQVSSVFRRLTVEQNLLAAIEATPVSRSLGRQMTRSERRERTDLMLAQFGLTHLRKNNAGRLSGGEKRRLEIARCLVCDPLLILLDEPFTGIDPQTIEDIQTIIRGLRDQGIGILITDHRARELLSLTDRCYVIHEGKVLTSGTSQQVIHDPVAIEEYLGNSFDEAALDHVVRQEKDHRLVEQMRTGDAAAAAELLRRGPAVVPVLLEALERRDVELRRRAFELLQRLVPGAAFDPYAPEGQRKQQIAFLRSSSSKGEPASNEYPKPGEYRPDPGRQATHTTDVNVTPENPQEPDESPPIDRPATTPLFLEGRLPLHVRLRDRVALEVRVVSQFRVVSQPASGVRAPLRDISPDPGGTEVLLVLNSPALTPVSENFRRVRVLPAVGSDWTLFELEARLTGVHIVEVTAYEGGAFLGNLRLQVTVDVQTQTGPTRQSTTPMVQRLREPGEVTLRIDYDDRENVYRYLLIDGTLGGPYLARGDRLKRTPQQAVEDLVCQMNKLARGKMPFGMAETRTYLKNKGIELWREFIPEEMQRRFWQLHSRITRMIILSQDDPVPWELLYPFARDGDAGFLVEQFPVARWVPEAPTSGDLSVGHAHFVVPDAGLPRASAEVEELRALMKERGVTGTEPIQELQQLLGLFSKTPFQLLHFACHNSFHPDSPNSSEIIMGRQPFQPTFLQEHADRFRPSSPLIFMNACRTDGQAPSYTRLAGWARSFLAAGAGAFIGSLWEVRDKTAGPFAREFYRALLQEATLGDALKAARGAIRDAPGDPTWLAYTLYGDPAARVSWRPTNGC